jgi:hypothetical protein
VQVAQSILFVATIIAAILFSALYAVGIIGPFA